MTHCVQKLDFSQNMRYNNRETEVLDMQISGRKIQIYPAEDAVVAVWVCTFGQEGEELAAAYQAQNYPPIALITVQTDDWDDILSPWAAPALGKGQQPFGRAGEWRGLRGGNPLASDSKGVFLP